MRDKIEYEVLPWHNRGWWCYSHYDSWGNYHGEVKLPSDDQIVAEILFYGGYGHDSWGSTYYLLNTNEVIHSSFYGESYCKVYRDENVIVKSVVMNLWAEKNHPKIKIFDLELFRQKFPLIYKITKYLYCKRDLSWLSVTIYDKKYNSICD
jgi:hypothetical protein